MRVNEFGLPIGPALDGFVAPERPRLEPFEGRFCRLEPLGPEHAEPLFEAFAEDDERMFTYLSFGPFGSAMELRALIEHTRAQGEWLGYAIHNHDGPVGAAHYMRIQPEAASVEVGAVLFSPALQRTPAATEAMYRMADRAFAQGYRRYEWKCDALNAASRRAAERLGFSFEGVHRNATVYKGRSRDTAWFSILDDEWPALREGFERWLAPGNFDPSGQQRSSLHRSQAR